MNKTILQVPLSKQLKDTAEKEAIAQGFSSLQEIVRVFLTKLASHKVDVRFQEPILLSEKNEERYTTMMKDFKENKNVFIADNIDELVKQLHDH